MHNLLYDDELSLEADQFNSDFPSNGGYFNLIINHDALAVAVVFTTNPDYPTKVALVFGDTADVNDGYWYTESKMLTTWVENH
jgi:hypothetical protein